jgi:hypothetical protein
MWLTVMFVTTVVRIGLELKLRRSKSVCSGFGRNLQKPLKGFSALKIDP